MSIIIWDFIELFCGDARDQQAPLYKMISCIILGWIDYYTQQTVWNSLLISQQFWSWDSDLTMGLWISWWISYWLCWSAATSFTAWSPRSFYSAWRKRCTTMGKPKKTCKPFNKIECVSESEMENLQTFQKYIEYIQNCLLGDMTILKRWYDNSEEVTW
jgi:hypothetical protein